MDKLVNRKWFRVLSKILIGIASFILLAVVGMRVYFRAPVHQYYKVSEKAFVIPGIKEGFVAQGISYDVKNDLFFVTGYMKDGSASPVYVVDNKTKKRIKTIRMINPDGSAMNGHAGGLSVFNDMVYVAGSEKGCFYGFNIDEILKAKDNSNLSYTEILPARNEEDMVKVSFTTAHNDMLYAGEFYRLPSYPVSDKHIVSCQNGENHAIMVGLKKLDDGMTPAVAYSLPDNVQGVCFANGKLYVSTSWSAGFSKIFAYDESKMTKGKITLLGRELPLYILDSNSLCESYKIAPMSEEIEFVDGKMYIMNESASNKYIFGKFTGGKWCYASKF